MVYVTVATTNRSAKRENFSGSFQVDTGAGFKTLPGRSQELSSKTVC